MVSPTTPLERPWMMGRWGKSKNKRFPRKLLIKKYIPTDSGQKKRFLPYNVQKKSLKIPTPPPPPPPNTFLMAIPYAKSDSPG